MSSTYFAGQLNQYHIQNYFRKIKHYHFDFKPFGFEVKKYSFFKKLKKTIMRNGESFLKGFPKWELSGRAAKHEVILSLRNVGVGCCNQHSTQHYHTN